MNLDKDKAVALLNQIMELELADLDLDRLTQEHMRQTIQIKIGE